MASSAAAGGGSGSGSGSSGGSTTIELFWSLLDKADRKFARLRDLPAHARSRNSSDGDQLGKAFRLYTRLWKLQQESRGRLVEAGLKRWEVGEMASRIAQLYHAQYLRTADAACLAEAFVFYEAILSRDYFKDDPPHDPALATKHLRFLARFLTVCLLLHRRDMLPRLVTHLRSLLDHCKRLLQDTELKEWKHLVQEITRFLKADTPFMNMRPLRYSFVFDPHPDSLSSSSCAIRRGLGLRDAILTSYRHNEVKFSDLTLDTFRMLQCLEWEPCGSFSLKNGAETGQHNGTGPSNINLLQDIRDPTLPPNPRKVILNRPSITNFLMVLATACEDLPLDGILLIYLSASGEGRLNLPAMQSSRISSSICENIETTSPLTSPPGSPTESSSQIKENIKCNKQPCLWLGSRGSGGSNCLCPCDLIPFTRKPLFLVIDSNSSHAFKAIHGEEKGETVAMLLSPKSPPTVASAADHYRHQNGSYFTMFLTAPVQAFCFLIGSSGANIEKDIYNKAEKLLSLSLSKWEMSLVKSDSLHPTWIETLGDPFLRRLLLRFIFCRAALALHKTTFGREEFLPACLPRLPELVDPECHISQYAVVQLANIFDATEQFVLSDHLVLPEPNTDEPTVIKASDIHESHFSAANGCRFE